MNALSLGLWLRKGGHRLGILFYLISHCSRFLLADQNLDHAGQTALQRRRQDVAG